MARTYTNGYQDKISFWSAELTKAITGESNYSIERCQGSYLYFKTKQIKLDHESSNSQS